MKRLLFFVILATMVLGLAAACEKKSEFDSETTPEPTVPLPTECTGEWSFSDDNSTFSFSSDPCAVVLENATVRLGWWEGDQVQTAAAADYPVRTVTETSTGYRWSLSGVAVAPEVMIEIVVDEKGGQAVLRTQVSSQQEMRLAWLELPGAALPETGVKIPTSAGDARWIQHGHDAWSFTGVEKLAINEPRPQETDGTLTPCGNNYNWDSLCHGESWWNGALTGIDRSAGLLWGALTAEHWKTYGGAWIEIDAALVRFKVIQGTPDDARRITPGSSLTMEPIWLMLSPRPALDMRHYAEAAAAETPPLDPGRPAPFGWATWYYYFSDINPEAVYENCGRLRELYPEVQPLLCQIDDGYETAFGDWYSYTPGFADGMAPVATSIREMGLMPGLWMAPLMADKSSQVVAEHPEWFVRDANGALYLWDDSKNLLDVAVPEAADHLRQIIADKVADGFEYLKLDFLFGGAFEVPHAGGLTSMEAYHQAMKLIQEGAGDDVYLLACGQPWLPTLGHFHAARDSGDIVASFPGFPLYQALTAVSRFHTVRAAFDGLWWANDPDNLVVRYPYTEEMAEIALAATWLGGSSNLLGDKLTILTDQRQALISAPESESIRGLGGAFWAVDLFDEPMVWSPGMLDMELAFAFSNPPKIWVRAVGEDRIVALFGWRVSADHAEFADYDLDADYRQGVKIERLYGSDAGLRRDLNGRWFAEMQGYSASVYRLSAVK